MLKRFIIIAVVISLLASCHDSSNNNQNGNPIDPNNPNKSTFILFDNTRGICAVSVYDDYRRRDDDKIVEIPSGKNSANIDWTSGDSVPFYFSYAVTFNDISDFTLNYVPEIGKDQKTVRIDADTTTTIKVPTLSETFSSSDILLSNNSYLFIQNNSSYSFELHQGTSKLKPDNISSFLVNNGEKAQYTINPGLASNYRLLVGADYKDFSGSIVNFEAGHIYNFDYNGSISLVKDTELKLENVKGFAIPQSPAAPVVITSNGSITLQWTAVESATAYEIWMATINDSASASKYGADVTASLSTTISGLNNGTTYYFWLKAKNNLGTSSFSPVVSGKPSISTVKPPDPQTAPSIIAGNGQLTVSWQAVESADVYEVWAGITNSVQTATKQGLDISGLSTVITGLNNGTTYYVWIKAKNNIGVSGFSPSATGKTLGTPETPPNNLTAGLYKGSQKIGNQNMADSLTYISSNAKNGDEYYIVLGSNESIYSGYFSYGITVGITLLGAGIERTITKITPTGRMFYVGYGVTLTLGQNITLVGVNENYASLIYVSGKLIMNDGAKIKGNTISHSDSSPYGGGGGVCINGGTFIMNGGEISGNTANDGYRYTMGGGVFVDSGTFILNGGEISSNSAISGGGVYNSGTFNMTGGVISDNIAKSGGGVYCTGTGIFSMTGGKISGNNVNLRGGGVYVYEGGTFTKSVSGTITGYGSDIINGNVVMNDSSIVQSNLGHAVYVNSSPVKSRESTAGPEVNLDSSVSGAAGGWE